MFFIFASRHGDGISCSFRAMTAQLFLQCIFYCHFEQFQTNSELLQDMHTYICVCMYTQTCRKLSRQCSVCCADGVFAFRVLCAVLGEQVSGLLICPSDGR